MALKPIIFKLKVMLSDLDRDHYESLAMTIAQHPSETTERMMIRMLAFCINAQERLSFTKGLSAPDEPDIWARSLDDRMLVWIDVGEPNFDRIKKASRIAQSVKVYSFNSKAEVWWNQEHKKFSDLPVDVFRFDWHGAQALAAMAQRTMDLSMTLSGNCAYVTAENGDCEVSWQPLQSG